MLTIDKLNEYGANTSEGLARCVNNQDLYFRLIKKAVEDNSFDSLKFAIEEKDYKKAFEISHSLKGVLGNLSLTPLYEIVYELTELLRNNNDVDYSKYIDELLIKKNELVELCK